LAIVTRVDEEKGRVFHTYQEFLCILEDLALRQIVLLCVGKDKFQVILDCLERRVFAIIYFLFNIFQSNRPLDEHVVVGVQPFRWFPQKGERERPAAVRM